MRASLPCDAGWTYFNGHCYLLVSMQRKSWDNASAYCEDITSYLIEITTDTEREFVNMLLRDYIRRWVWFWTGATDRDTEGTFVYQHSREHVPKEYWRIGEPNDYAGREQCAGMTKYYGDFEFQDEPCIGNFNFICEKP